MLEHALSYATPEPLMDPEIEPVMESLEDTLSHAQHELTLLNPSCKIVPLLQSLEEIRWFTHDRIKSDEAFVRWCVLVRMVIDPSVRRMKKGKRLKMDHEIEPKMESLNDTFSYVTPEFKMDREIDPMDREIEPPPRRRKHHKKKR